MNEKTLGQLAYDGYRTKSGGVSLVSGYQIPEWGGLDPVIRDAWEAAAQAVYVHLIGSWGNMPPVFVADDQGGHLEWNEKTWRPER